MENYVTLFDHIFLPQGLALHISMERHAGEYTLWILCMDDVTHDSLTSLSLSNVRLLRLSELETECLKRIRPTRTSKEYCWTLTPFAPRFVFEAAPSVSRVTYLDADMWFRKNPAPIFREFDASGKNVLITDHAYAPEYDRSAVFGQYCVQFLTFTRDGGEIVRKWWEDKCVEWCHARVENGKFGDQKYLDDWPERFTDEVHVLDNKEVILAPWNATRFPYGHACLWHFQGLRLTKGRKKLGFYLSDHRLPKPVKDYVYQPYLEDIRLALNLLRNINTDVIPQMSALSRIVHLKRFLSAWRQSSLSQLSHNT